MDAAHRQPCAPCLTQCEQEAEKTEQTHGAWNDPEPQVQSHRPGPQPGVRVHVGKAGARERCQGQGKARHPGLPLSEGHSQSRACPGRARPCSSGHHGVFSAVPGLTVECEPIVLNPPACWSRLSPGKKAGHRGACGADAEATTPQRWRSWPQPSPRLSRVALSSARDNSPGAVARKWPGCQTALGTKPTSQMWAQHEAASDLPPPQCQHPCQTARGPR